MREVKIVRRWGSHQPGEVVELDDTQANWLVGIQFAEDPNNEGSSRSNAKAEGTDGADPRAGGDPSRRRMTSARSARVANNLSGRVQGAPRASGDVTHVAPENLGREHGDNPNDVLLASGKRLSEDLAEYQRGFDEQDKRDQGRSKGEKSESARTDSGESPAAAGKDSDAEGRKLTQSKKGS